MSRHALCLTVSSYSYCAFNPSHSKLPTLTVEQRHDHEADLQVINLQQNAEKVKCPSLSVLRYDLQNIKCRSEETGGLIVNVQRV